MKTGAKIRKSIAEILIGFVIGLNAIHLLRNGFSFHFFLTGIISVAIISMLVVLWLGNGYTDD